MNFVLDVLELRREARQDRRSERHRQLFGLRSPNTPSADRTQSSEHVRTRESDIHLRYTP
jgi:hypothetical protein